MDVSICCGACSLGRSLEQRSDVNVHAEVGIGGRNNLLSTIVAILPHFGDEDTRATTFLSFKGIGHGDGFLHVRHGAFLSDLFLVHARQSTDLSLMAAENLLQRIGNFADGCLCASCIHRQFQEVLRKITSLLILAGRSSGQSIESCLAGFLVTLSAKAFELFKLFSAHLGVVHLQHFDLLVFLNDILVHADQRLAARVNARLSACGGFLDTQLRNTLNRRLSHAACGLNFFDVGACTVGQLIGQPLNVVGTCPRVDRANRVGFLLEKQLSVAGDTG